MLRLLFVIGITSISYLVGMSLLFNNTVDGDRKKKKERTDCFESRPDIPILYVHCLFLLILLFRIRYDIICFCTHRYCLLVCMCTVYLYIGMYVYVWCTYDVKKTNRIWHPITQFGGSGPHAMNCIPMMLEIE